jgi:hypothetical protein
MAVETLIAALENRIVEVDPKRSDGPISEKHTTRSSSIEAQ